MIGVCKFCKCSDNSPCFLGMQGPCAWLLEDVCTNPDCVLKAYLEARPRAESLMRALELPEVA
ncbi:MAG: hypothetical protein JWO19_4386 [Bryobacterales bacterium]|nr:hypothetical protein [Bryobacterales bacterium]